MSKYSTRAQHNVLKGQSFQTRRSKLTPIQRDEIRRRLSDGESPQVLALEFGVSASYVREMLS